MKPVEVPQLFAQYWNAKDARGLAGLFAENADFVNVVGLWWHHRESIFKAHDYGLKTIFSHSNLKVMKTTVKMLKKDVALIHARLRLTGQSAHRPSSEPGVRFNVFTFVVQRFQDNWLCVAAHNTDVVPGAETWINREGTLTPVSYTE